MIEFNPSRLEVARTRSGLSQRDLAERLRCTDRTVRRWESGAVLPTLENLVAISKVTGFPLEFFSRPDVEELPKEAVSFRSLTKLRAADRDRAIAAGRLALELSDWQDANFNLPSVDVPQMPHQAGKPEAAAMELRSRWGLGDKPIKNMIALLEFKGVRVFSLAEECREMDAFSMWRSARPFVFLNTMKTSEHSRFDAAHELAHLVLHSNGGAPGQHEEREANAFAAEFLMPRSSIQNYAPRVVTLSGLVRAKKMWNVSVAALAYRLNELGLITDYRYRSLCIEIQKAGYRRSEPDSAPREMSQVWDKVFRSLRESGVTKQKLAEQLGWPLRELNALVFGLVLRSIPGGSIGEAQDASELTRAKLRLVK